MGDDHYREYGAGQGAPCESEWIIISELPAITRSQAKSTPSAYNAGTNFQIAGILVLAAASLSIVAQQVPQLQCHDPAKVSPTPGQDDG
jgi:hypothetical protein